MTDAGGLVRKRGSETVHIERYPSTGYGAASLCGQRWDEGEYDAAPAMLGNPCRRCVELDSTEGRR